jgi:hypothetical protein
MKDDLFKNLNSISNFERIKEIADDIVEHQVADEAQNFYNDLEKKLKESGIEGNVELYKRYQKILGRVGLTALPCFPVEKFYDVVRKNIAVGLADDDIDLVAGIRRKLIEYPMAFRDDIKVNARKALRESTSTLGSKPIVSSDKKEKSPTVGNWIRDYDKFLGMGKHSRVEQSDYLFKSDNVKGLKPEERKKLDHLIRLYEKLKWSSYELGAIDNPSLEIFLPVTGPVERSHPRELGKLRDRKRPSIPTGINPKEARAKEEPEEKRSLGKLSDMPVKRAFTPESQDEKKERVQEKVSATEEPKSMPKPRKLAKPKSDLEMKAEQLRKGVPERGVNEKKPKDMSFDIKSKHAKAPKAISDKSLKKLSTPQSVSQLDINDFRNFGKDAASSSTFIQSKISKLSSYSPLDKETVKSSLRKSELYRLYLSQGKESLDLKKGIGEVVELRKKDGRPYMEEDEYEAVKNLFKSI